MDNKIEMLAEAIEAVLFPDLSIPQSKKMRKLRSNEIEQIITDHIGPDLEERDKLREFFERAIADKCWDGLAEYYLDGGTLQDTAIEMGILIKVPADEEYKAEWPDDDTMFIWTWSDRAKHKGGE